MSLDDILKGNYDEKEEVVYFFKVNWDNEPIEMAYCPQKIDAEYCLLCKRLFGIARWEN